MKKLFLLLVVLFFSVEYYCQSGYVNETDASITDIPPIKGENCPYTIGDFEVGKRASLTLTEKIIPQPSVAINWAGTISTNWGTAGNWSTGTVPTNVDDVTIPAGTPFSPYANAIAATCRDITINVGATLKITVTTTANGLDVYGNVLNNGTFDIDGSGGPVFLDGIGKTIGGTGTYTSTGSFTYSGFDLGYFVSTASYTLTGNVTTKWFAMTYGPFTGMTLSLGANTIHARQYTNWGGTLNQNTGTLEVENTSAQNVFTAPYTFNENTGTTCFCSGDFDAAAAQNVQAETYYNLRIRTNNGFVTQLRVITCQDYTQTNPSTAGGIVQINGAGTRTVNGNLTLGTGSTLTVGNTSIKTIDLDGNWTNNGTLIPDVTPALLTVILNGAAGQTIGGTTSTTFYNLTVNKATGTTFLGTSATVGGVTTLTGVMNFQAGIFDLNANTLTIANAIPGAITRTTGYALSENTSMLSRIQWNMGANITAGHIFPFGTSTGVYIPFTFDPTVASANNVTLATFKTNQANSPSPPTVANQNSTTGLTCSFGGGNNNCDATVDRFWQITVTGTPTATLRFGFDAAAGPGGEMEAAPYGVVANQRAQRYNTGTNKWEASTGTQTTGTTGGYNWVNVTGITAFSPWGIASNLSPLPISLISFEANPGNNNVLLDWTTATEINNDYFTIERSADGINFEKVGTTPSKALGGNSTSNLYYNLIDETPLSGISYYRLMQTDKDGKFSYSDLVAVNFNPIDNGVIVAPNPVNENNIVVSYSSSSDNVTTTINIYDVTGQIVYKQNVNSTEGTNAVVIDVSTLSKGMYFISVSDQNKSGKTKLIRN